MNMDLEDIGVVDALWLWDCAGTLGTLAEGNREEESVSNVVVEVGHKADGLDRVYIVMMDESTMPLGQSELGAMEEVAGIVALEARP